MIAKRLLGMALCLTLGLSLASAGETFKLGAFLQLTGNTSAFGVEARNSCVLAVEQFNAEGGFNGVPVELIIYDTQGSPEEAIKIASRLIDVDRVDAVIGSVNSNEVLAAGKYLDDAKIPTFGLGTSPTWMNQGWKYVFRPAVNNVFSAILIANMAASIGMKRMAIFKGQDHASLATGNAFAKASADSGMTVVADESYDVGDTDFSAQVSNMIESDPHAVFLATVGDIGPVIVKQLRQFGYDGIILYKDSFAVAQVEIAGKEAANDILFASPYVTYTTVEECDIPIVRDYLEKYQAKFGHPSMTDSSYRGWDAMLTLREAVRIAGKNERQAITDAVKQVKIEGLGGTLDYTDGKGEGYGTKFNAFAFIDQKNILFSKWLAEGGYEAYKKKTGNEH